MSTKYFLTLCLKKSCSPLGIQIGRKEISDWGRKILFCLSRISGFCLFPPESDPDNLRENCMWAGRRGGSRGRKRQKSILFLGGRIHLLAFMTKYHRVGGLKNKNVSLHSSRGQKSKIKVLTGFILRARLGLQMPVFSLCLHLVFSLHVHMSVS